MHSSNYIYHHGEQELHGFLAYDDRIDAPRPAVLIAPDWSGRNELVCTKAKLLADMGYLAFALDMYGHGRVGITTDEKKALMDPFVNDRLLLGDRVRAAYDAVVGMSEVDVARVAIIGFCFGGLCALDLARSGLDIKGAVSFHGLLNKPKGLSPAPIKAKILALHGYDDPMVRPEQVNEFCHEMTEAKADWQVHSYGHVQHAFTNPDAQDAHAGLVYNDLAAKRAWNAMTGFFQEIF
jgi:dienelactone hydrolase